MCRSPLPLDMSPSSSKAMQLGSVHTSPGVAGLRTPAEWWVLRAWACLDQGLIFPLKMRKGLWHAPMRVSTALWSSCLGGCSYLRKGLFYLLPPLSFLSSSSSSSSLTSTQVSCRSLRRSSACPCSLPPLISNFPFLEYNHPIFTTSPTLLSLLPLLHPTLFFFFSVCSILSFQHMTDCVINEHHKPLFLLATH